MNSNSGDQNIISAFMKVAQSFEKLFKSEIQLAKAESKSALKSFERHIILTITFGVFALAGLFPFMVFLIIIIGKSLNNNYWLSSLILALISFIGGGLLSYRMFSQIKAQDFTFPHLKESLNHEKDVLKKNVNDVVDITRRRAL